MSRTETAISLVRVAVRAPAHVFAAVAQAFDSIEHDFRTHVMAEPSLGDSMRESVMREAEEIRRTGNQHAPVDISQIPAN